MTYDDIVPPSNPSEPPVRKSFTRTHTPSANLLQHRTEEQHGGEEQRLEDIPRGPGRDMCDGHELEGAPPRARRARVMHDGRGDGHTQHGDDGYATHACLDHEGAATIQSSTGTGDGAEIDDAHVEQRVEDGVCSSGCRRQEGCTRGAVMIYSRNRGVLRSDGRWASSVTRAASWAAAGGGTHTVVRRGCRHRMHCALYRLHRVSE